MERRATLGLALLVALLVGLLLGASVPRAETAGADAGPQGPGRYEMANFSGIGLSVLDTHTGAIYSYRVSTDGPWRQLAPTIPQ